MTLGKMLQRTVLKLAKNLESVSRINLRLLNIKKDKLRVIALLKTQFNRREIRQISDRLRRDVDNINVQLSADIKRESQKVKAIAKRIAIHHKRRRNYSKRNNIEESDDEEEEEKVKEDKRSQMDKIFDHNVFNTSNYEENWKRMNEMKQLLKKYETNDRGEYGGYIDRNKNDRNRQCDERQHDKMRWRNRERERGRYNDNRRYKNNAGRYNNSKNRERERGRYNDNRRYKNNAGRYNNSNNGGRRGRKYYNNTMRNGDYYQRYNTRKENHALRDEARDHTSRDKPYDHTSRDKPYDHTSRQGHEEDVYSKSYGYTARQYHTARQYDEDEEERRKLNYERYRNIRENEGRKRRYKQIKHKNASEWMQASSVVAKERARRQIDEQDEEEDYYEGIEDEDLMYDEWNDDNRPKKKRKFTKEEIRGMMRQMTVNKQWKSMINKMENEMRPNTDENTNTKR
eukprot:498671_1